MTKNEQKYINSIKEENERIKNMLLRFVDAIGKLKNIDDVVNVSLIPLMTEENQKIRVEIKAEAYKECIEKVKATATNKKLVYVADVSIQEQETGWLEIQEMALNNLLKELVGE